MAALALYSPVVDLISPLTYSAEVNIVFCQQCKCSLSGLINIKRHIMQKHMLRGSDLKTFIKQLQAKLELLGIRSLNRPGLISNPEPYAARFRDLEEIPGYSYRSCPYLTRSYKNLRAYLNVQHQIKGTDTRGDTLTPSYRFPITLQTFSRNPRNVSYFIAKGSLCARQSPLQTPLDQLLASYQQSQAQALAGLPEPQIQEPSRKELPPLQPLA